MKNDVYSYLIRSEFVSRSFVFKVIEVIFSIDIVKFSVIFECMNNVFVFYSVCILNIVVI